MSAVAESISIGQGPEGRPHAMTRPAASRDLAPGATLDGRFELTGLVSRTGMASIFKARDLKSGAEVAVKVPVTECEEDPLAFDRFRREEEIGLKFDHPDIVKVIPADGPRSQPYLAMEFLRGERLDQLMARAGPLPEGQAVAIASRLCAALDHMHGRDVVHRDMKPENVMIGEDGAVSLFDFGIAKDSHLNRMTFAGLTEAMGTPDYMAPERVKGQRGDERTDVYGLGAILYEMATGAPPFQGDSVYALMNARIAADPVAPRRANPRISPVLEEIILHAMERDPLKRYASAAAMKAELDDHGLVKTTDRCEHLATGAARSPGRRLLAVAGSFLVLQIIVFGLVYLRSPHFGK
jgi:serine/threonine protein kinase